MPGTIQVSVLEFMGLPSSSPSSSTSIKVTMGKREYQTRDKGNFSFPLTTLRETLIVTLQDDEGKEISRTGVGIMSIVERGVWDDIFPLEGGGHVHMKLQFTLTEDDRNRIRSMRESALKKKKEEVFNSSVSSQEGTRNDDSNAALSSRHNDEVSGVVPSQDSPKRSIHSEAVSSGDADTQAGSQSNPNTCFEDSKPYTENKEESSPYEQKNPNDTDRSEVSSSTIPISQKFELQKELLGNTAPPFLQETSTTSLGSSETFATTKNISDRSEVSSSTILVSQNVGLQRELLGNSESSITPSFLQEASTTLESSEIFASTKHISDRSEVSSSKIPISQKVELQKDFPGNSDSSITPPFPQEASTTLGSSEIFAATKNISVSVKPEGESTVKPEKQGPLEKTPSSVRKMITAFENNLAQDVKPRHPDRVVMEGLVKDQNLKNVDYGEKLSSDKPKSPIMKPDERVGFDRNSGGTDSRKQTIHLKESSTVQIQSKETSSSEREKLELLHEEDQEERRQCQENLMLTSDIETATVSGRMLNEHSSRHQTWDLLSALEERGRASMESGRKISSDSHEINTWDDSNDKLKPESYYEDGDYSVETSGVWIFPDEKKRFCITTGGKEVMDFMGGCRVEAKTHQIEKNVPITENQDLQGGADVEIKKGEKTSPKLRKSTSRSPEAVASTGPVGQAIKIAIMVGFGALVLFTRQRKSRKSNTEEKNPFLEIPEFIDELLTI